MASFKSGLLALFKFHIKIKVAHLGEEGGSPYQNVSIKCQDNIFSTYTNLLKTKNCHITIAFFKDTNKARIIRKIGRKSMR